MTITGAVGTVYWGYWISYAGYCRSAGRGIFNPGNRDSYFGFRVVLAPGQP